MANMYWRTGGMKISKFVGGILIGLAISTAGYSLDLEYKGQPFIVNASYKASNIIILPEPVKSAYSSQQGVQVNYTEESNKLIVAIPNKPSDLVIEGESGKVYIFNLNPVAMPSQVFTVKDKKLIREKRLLFEAKNEIDDLLSSLIKDVALDKVPDGYTKHNFSRVLAAKDVLIVGKYIYKGGSFRIYVVDVVNRTKNIIRVREDTRFAEKVALKIAGLKDTTDLRALSFSREIIKPKDYATLYIVVNEYDTPLIWRKLFQRYE